MGADGALDVGIASDEQATALLVQGQHGHVAGHSPPVGRAHLALVVLQPAVPTVQPLAALLIGWLFLREVERITAQLIGGVALAVAGTLLVII